MICYDSDNLSQNSYENSAKPFTVAILLFISTCPLIFRTLYERGQQ